MIGNDMSVLINLRDHQKLPEAENQVRKYILQNPKEILAMSIHELARKTYTSPATVVRLCKRLEVKGYNQLKIQLSSEIKSFDNLHLELLDTTTIQKDDKPETIIDKITNIAVESIEETRLLIDQNVLMEGVKSIFECKVLDLYGVGASNVVAVDALYKFMRVGKIVACYQLNDRQKVQALNSDSSHTAIIFSYSGETKEMIEVANILRNNGVKIITVTSTTHSTLSQLADVSIHVSTRETVFRSGAMASRTSSLYIVDMLYALYCSMDYHHASEMIEKTRIVSKTN